MVALLPSKQTERVRIPLPAPCHAPRRHDVSYRFHPVVNPLAEAVTADRPLYDDGLVQMGVRECRPGTFGEDTGAMNESMFMVAGRATVQHADGAFDLSPGTLWTTPHQWSNTWSVHQTVRKLYVIDRRPGTPGEFAFRREGYQEVFCVLSGRATVHVEHPGGRGQSFELMHGAVMLTPSGLTGRWVVHETIRKAYTIITD